MGGRGGWRQLLSRYHLPNNSYTIQAREMSYLALSEITAYLTNVHLIELLEELFKYFLQFIRNLSKPILLTIWKMTTTMSSGLTFSISLAPRPGRIMVLMCLSVCLFLGLSVTILFFIFFFIIILCCWLCYSFCNEIVYNFFL